MAVLVDVLIGDDEEPIRGRERVVVVNEMQEAQDIDGAQEAQSEQAVEPRYLLRRTSARATQVETAPHQRDVSNRNLKQHVSNRERIMKFTKDMVVKKTVLGYTVPNKKSEA